MEKLEMLRVNKLLLITGNKQSNLNQWKWKFNISESKKFNWFKLTTSSTGSHLKLSKQTLERVSEWRGSVFLVNSGHVFADSDIFFKWRQLKESLMLLWSLYLNFSHGCEQTGDHKIIVVIYCYEIIDISL